MAPRRPTELRALVVSYTRSEMMLCEREIRMTDSGACVLQVRTSIRALTLHLRTLHSQWQETPPAPVPRYVAISHLEVCTVSQEAVVHEEMNLYDSLYANSPGRGTFSLIITCSCHVKNYITPERGLACKVWTLTSLLPSSRLLLCSCHCLLCE